MSWITQKTGIINQYREAIHFGTQPVRVIHHMLAFMFQNTHPLFFEELKNEIAKGKVEPKLSLTYGRESIRMDNGKLRTPRVDLNAKTIELHETFLSYLWCCTYSIYIQYLEKVDYPRVNKLNGMIVHPISQENIEMAEQVFDYARSLIVGFTDWDKDNFPNPEIYLAENRNYVEQPNMFYTEAVKFILCHEYTHLKLHAEQIDENTQNSHFLFFEIEADNNAIDMLIAGFFPVYHFAAEAQRLAIIIGTIIGILSMLFFSSETTGIKHPNTEDRLTNALERFQIDDKHEAWGIACLGLQIWDNQFNLNLIWDEKPISHKDQYYKIIAQIKAQQ